jgi:hypothetical protein
VVRGSMRWQPCQAPLAGPARARAASLRREASALVYVCVCVRVRVCVCGLRVLFRFFVVGLHTPALTEAPCR